MLKIKKTKPYQHNSSVHIIICAIALICGIVPSLVLLTYYNPYTESTYAAETDTRTLSDISTMQEMTTDICTNSKKYETNTLRDTRDNNEYTVTKLDDNNCWMTQNLRIVDKEITPEDSDVAESYTIPASSTKWSDTDNTEAGLAQNVYYGDEIMGAYYSWCAATAGSCTINGANYSVCPKGWILPNQNAFATLFSAANIADDLGGSEKIQNSPYNFTLAGIVGLNGALPTVGGDGHYWTRSSDTGVNVDINATRLNISKTRVYIDNYRRYMGISVRCLAPGYSQSDSTVSVTVPKVLSIDAISDNLVLEADPNLITKGNISATISANTTYSVQLSAEKTSLTNSQNPEDTEITNTNSIPASSNIQAKTNAWGILNSDNITYSAITSTPTTYHNTETANEDSSRTHTFTLGVSVSPTLPAGEYSTTVTITAVNN